MKRVLMSSGSNSHQEKSMERKLKEKRKSDPSIGEAKRKKQNGIEADDSPASCNGLNDTLEGQGEEFWLPSTSEQCFEWLIHPVNPKQFFSEIWEKKPYLVKRHSATHYQGVFSCAEMQSILSKNIVQFGKHLDVTSYRDGVRETHNPAGRAYPAVVWDYFQKGCSVRMLSPQTYSKKLWKINSLLQTFFGSFVGANVYLTPKGTQGFAPHYDDIEAFILQLEGKKHWRVYAPKDPSEELPRFSSPNFSQEEIGEPILTVELEPGDLLYFPRGFIHQAQSDEDIHSLHITLSTYQKTSWGDLFEKLVSNALDTAIQDDVEFRKSLPIGYLRYMGVAHSESESNSRTDFLLNVSKLFKKILQYLPVDAGVDQMGKDFIHSSLPHKLTKDERLTTIHGNGDRWENGRVKNINELCSKSQVRLIDPMTVRLVMEEDVVRIYHSFENTLTYQEVEPQYIEIGADLAPAVEQLLRVWPEYIAVENFEVASGKLEDQLDVVNLLYDKGLLATKKPLALIGSS